MERFNKRWMLILLSVIPALSLLIWFILLIVALAVSGLGLQGDTGLLFGPGEGGVFGAAFFFLVLWVTSLSLLLFFIFGIRHPGNSFVSVLFIVLIAVQIITVILTVVSIGFGSTLDFNGGARASFVGASIALVVFWFVFEIGAIFVPFTFTVYYFYISDKEKHLATKRKISNNPKEDTFKKSARPKEKSFVVEKRNKQDLPEQTPHQEEYNRKK